VSPPATAVQLARTPKKAKPSAAARPSAAERRDSEVSPDDDTTQQAHTQNYAATDAMRIERGAKTRIMRPPRTMPLKGA
jgi:hypothetical protein